MFVKLLRIKQWIKNLFLFIPIFFAGELFNSIHYSNLILGFFAYSFAASAIYILNDYKDIESDRLHPQKKLRPLVTGIISVKSALTIMIVLLITSLGIAFLVNTYFLIILLIYLFLNLLYSLGLKHISILDILIVASGFLFRILAGGILADIPVSQWLIIMVFLLAVFLGLAKRRDDIIVYMESGQMVRKSSKQYNLDFANACLTMLSAVIIVSYIMYTISDDVIMRHNTNNLYYTGVFVIAGIMRYLQITLVENNSGSPTNTLYSDTFLRVTLIGWILTFYIIIYFHKV